MKDLIAQLEAATEGSQELDVAIIKATGQIPKGMESCGVWSNNGLSFMSCRHTQERPSNYNHPPVDILVLAYTTSLDAALTLVPDGLNWGVDWRADREQFTALVGEHLGQPTGGSAALAFCIAALRARSLP